MKIPVHMLAFMNGEIREVTLENEVSLDEVFRLGQNEFQPVPGRCSVSVGDVIEMGGKYHIVEPVGFREMPPEEFALYKAMDRDKRYLHRYGILVEDSP